MSLASDRQEFADALSRVEGVRSATAYPPVSYDKGAAYPSIVALDGDRFDSGPLTWVVTVVLGQDIRAAELLLDSMLPSLRQELRPLMTLTRLAPGTMQVEGGQVLVVQQTGVREFDA